MKPKSALRSCLALAGSTVLAISYSHAATITWDGDTSVTWATGGNWTGSVAPANSLATDIANFNLASTTFAPNAGTTSINGITIGSSNGAMTLTTTNLSIGGSGITIDNGAGALTVSGTVTIGAAQTWTNNDGDTATFGVVALGVNKLTLAGGNFLFTGTNTGTGGIDLSTGSNLIARAAGSLGPNTNTVFFKGGNLELRQATGATAGTVFTGKLDAVTNGGTITINRTDNTSVATTHTVGTLAIGAGNTLNVVAGSNITSGTAYGLTTGVLTLSSGGATINVANNGAGIGTMTVAAPTGNFTLTKTGAGDLVTNSITTGFSGSVDIQAGRVGWSGASGTINEAQSFSGAGGIIKSGASTVNLSGAQNYAGGTTITGGTLNFVNQTSLYNGTTGSWTAANISVANGATLAFNVGGVTNEFTTGNVTTLLTNLGGANGTSTTGFAAGSSIGFDTTNAAGGTFTVADVIANSTGSGGGAIGLTKLGTNTLVLSNSNTYTGTTSITAGTLSLTGSLDGTAISTSGTGILNQSAAGVISGTSSFTQESAGTTSVLAGTNTYTGPTTITNGTLQLGSGTGTGSLSTSSAISVESGATFAVNQSDTVTQGVEFSNAPISGLGNFTQAGPGTTVLNLANTFSGTTTASAGNITLNNALALQNSPLDTTGAGSVTLGTEHCGDPITTLTLGGLTDSGTTRNLADVITNYNTLNALTLNLGTGSTQTYDGIIGEGATGMDLTKTGAGTQILTGANSYTGTTAINNGTLTLSGAAGAIASSTAITINRGTLNLTNADNDTEDGLNRIKDDAAITSNGGTLNYTTTTATSTRNFIETIGSVSLATGQLDVVQTLNKTAGSQTLALSGLSQAGTGSVTFSNSGGLNLTNDRIRVDGITTDTTAGQIIGAYATLGTTAASQTDYAVYDSDGTDGYIQGANIAASGQSTWTTAANAYTANAGAAAGGSTGLSGTRTITALKSISGANAMTVDNALDIFTLASNTFANGDAFVLGGTAPSGLTSGNTYYVINKSGDTFQLSTTSGGAASLFTTNGTSVTATGAITLSTGNNLETYGLLNGVGTTMHVRANGTGAVTTPTGGGNLHVNAGVGGIQMNAPITNNGGNVTLVKNGSGALTLATSSTFTGGLVLNAGTLNVSVAQSFTGGITINGGDLRPTSSGTTLLGSNVVTFADSGSINTGGVNGTYVIPSAVINSGATATVSAGGGGGTTYTFTNGVSGSGNLVFDNGTSADNDKILNLNNSSGLTGTVTMAVNTSGSVNRAQLHFSALGDGGKIVNSVSTTDLAITYSGAAATGMTFNTRQLEISTSRGVIINSNGTGALVFNQPLSVITNTGGKTLTLSGTTTLLQNAFNGQISNGSGAINLAKTGASTWNVTNASNSYTGSTIVNAGVLGFASGALGSVGGINASAGTLLWLAGNTQDISSRLTMTAATASTFHTNGNDVNFANAVGSSSTGSLSKTGLGTLTLNGLNTYTGSTTLNAGKLKLNYNTGTGGVNDSKLSNTAVSGTLLLNGGTLELSGGSHVETVLSTTLNTGGTFITQPTGTSTLSMGAITFTGGAIDFAEDSIATTSTGVTNGILSQRATVAGANFAMKSGSDIVAYDYVTSGVTGYTGTAMSASTNYALQTAGGANTLSGTTGATTNTLKIANTATGSLAVAANTLTVGTILFAGSADYDITTSGSGRVTPTILHNYGTGGAVLNLGALGGTLTQFGTGKTVLTNAALINSTLNINGGTVQISANNQIGTNTGVVAITLNNGTLLASETLALNNGGLNSRTVTLGAGGGTLAAADTKTLTVSGVISGAGALTVGTASSAGTVTLSGTNTYSGDTTVSAGTLLVSGSIGNSAVTVTGTDTILATDAAASFGSTVTINNGAILAAGGAAAAGTATVSGGTTFNNDSIFSWDISANGATYDKVITPTLAGELAAGDAIFRIVLADSTFADTFWDSNQTWTDIFTTNGTSPLTDWASVFGDSVLVVDSSFNPVAGAFTLNCNTLSYTFAAIPEPTSALAGLLLGAGLLRRRRAA